MRCNYVRYADFASVVLKSNCLKKRGRNCSKTTIPTVGRIVSVHYISPAHIYTFMKIEYFTNFKTSKFKDAKN